MRKIWTHSGLVLALLGSAPVLAQADTMAGMHQALPRTLADWAQGARLFPDMGDFHRSIATSSRDAQAFFDQGMRFLWAFNHDEAARSFARAAQLDPKCAMCFWGVGLTLGPNYNMPLMAAARARVGWQAVQQAQALASATSSVDQALIAALAKRFDGAKPIDPSNYTPLLAAYADAMREAARRFPEDLDLQVMSAEAQMNLHPWKLWNAEGQPMPGTAEIVSTLEGVLAKAPAHPGANHYFIHAVEASNDPAKAIPSAERLAMAMPAAGHLVHMPSHIMQRVGRYEDSAEANRRAAKADAAYYTQTSAIDYYPMYSAHNLQFLAAAAAMEGRRAETVSALREVRKTISDDMVAGMDGIDWVVAFLYEANVRFGLWDAMLAEPQPDPRLKTMVVSYHANRAIALAAKGNAAAARSELGQARQAADAIPSTALGGMNAAHPLLEIAILRARSRIAAASGDKAGAVAALSEAVSREDGLSYNEPADEFFPTRHLLGAALLDAGQAAPAEAVYREDLRRNPANGWSQMGLTIALRRQGREQEAAAQQKLFETAWSRPDTRITGSAF